MFLGALATASGACKSEGRGTPDKRVAEPATPKRPQKKRARVHVDASLMAGMKAVVDSCEVNLKSLRVRACKNKEFDALRGMIGPPPKLHQLLAISTVATALGDEDPRLRTVAAKLMRTKFSTSWGGAHVGSVSAPVARRLLRALPKLGTVQRRAAIVGAVHTASLAGGLQHAIEAIERDPDKQTQVKGWSAVMLYGRMQAFPAIKKLAQSDDRDLVRAALTAASSFFPYSAVEKAKLCPWAEGFLGRDDPAATTSPIFRKAGAIISRCRGEHLDRLLAFGEAQLTERAKFDRDYYFVYRSLCISFSRRFKDDPAQRAQCDRNFAFLESVAGHSKVTAKLRAQALAAISYQLRTKEALPILRRYAEHEVPQLRETALKEIAALEARAAR